MSLGAGSPLPLLFPRGYADGSERAAQTKGPWTGQSLASCPGWCEPRAGIIDQPRPIETMLLSLTTTHRPATNLGYLLYKNPTAVRSVDMWFGQAHVFHPEANEDWCTAALLLEVDPMGWSGGGGE